MLSSLHFILTYKCNFECDHCFLYCHPFARGVYTLARMEQVLDDLKQIPGITSLGFEGGEPFIYYPLVLESVKMAVKKGFKTDIQTNCYWATSQKDAELWLKPLYKAGLSSIDVSDDAFHHGEGKETPAKNAAAAARDLGLKVSSICIQPPEVGRPANQEKGNPIYLGGPKLRGRAVEKLTPGLPVRPWEEFTQCPFEDFQDPKRVHVDPFGNVHLCQGILMGNLFHTPFREMVAGYDPHAHPICGPIIQGGPARLAQVHGLDPGEKFVDACHFCTILCLSLMDRFPEILGPRQVYGLKP
ncbi:radical SAM protein [Desulfospira joergensenii]|uniref:radical SAM protein n=1 Tax=Desulfospira joergensenii TaxID=53329 RepID=UPI0003B64DE1|nr:radical SAM protein [Desulfospira joergensenii]